MAVVEYAGNCNLPKNEELREVLIKINNKLGKEVFIVQTYEWVIKRFLRSPNVIEEYTLYQKSAEGNWEIVCYEILGMTCAYTHVHENDILNYLLGYLAHLENKNEEK